MIELGNRRHLAAAIALALAACSGGDEAGEQAAQTEVSDETLATLVAGDANLATASQALEETGLAQVFEGVAAYTFLAPTDEAFDRLGEASADLRSPEQRPAMAFLMSSGVR